MENVRIAVLSANEIICTFLDNQASGALHYSEACLHTYLRGSAYTIEIKTDTSHEDTRHLIEGNKVAFVHKGKDYMCNIVTVERNETEITISGWGLVLELTNESRGAYTSNGAMSLVQYINYFDPEHTLTLGINEVSDKSISNEWTGNQTILARLYSIATLFNAEMEFITELNDDYSLKQVTLNVYQEHDTNHQGMGENREDKILRFGTTIETIRKTSDITDLFTAILVTGKDGLTIAGMDKKVYDEDGNLEFYVGSTGNILAPQARDRFPSNLKSNDRYILKEWSYDSDKVETLYGQALAQLKKYCVPQVEYEIKGYHDADIGDTFTIEDCAYKPMLILSARVTEQEEYFVDTTKNTTTYSNAEELQSGLDPSLISAMQKLIEQNKVYTCNISTNNGIIFKNSIGTTTLTAQVKDGATDVTNTYIIKWYKDGLQISTTERNITVSAADVSGKAVYKFIAYNSSGSEIGEYEVTITNINDGQKGADGTQGTSGAKGADGLTPYLHIAYANSENGVTGFSTTDSTNKLYIGQYTDYTAADSATPSKYAWTKIKGDIGSTGPKGDTGATGSQGVAGPKGTDGTNYYTWLKYADSPTTGMSDNPDNKSYIGLAYNKTTATESNNYSDYTWSLVKGAKGDTGVSGAKGADGVTTYTWIKYGTSATGTGLSDSPTGKTYIGLAYNKTTATESTNPEDYTWSLIQGAQGPKGDTGATGAKGDKGETGARGPTGAAGATGKGISSAIVAYQASTSGTSVPTGTWYTSVPSVPAGQYLWTRTVYTYTDSTTFVSYSVGKMGETGATGSQGTNGRGISGTAVTYQASSSGTTAPTGTWYTSVPSVSAGQYLWTRTITTYTDGASTTAYSVGRMGINGTNGSNGTSGIIVSATAPSNPTSGQLWQNTSDGLIRKFNGSTWDIWYLKATNISTDNLSAISANIGPFQIAGDGFSARGHNSNEADPYNAYLALDSANEKVSMGYTLGETGGGKNSIVSCQKTNVVIGASGNIVLNATNVMLSGSLIINNQKMPIIKTYSGTLAWGTWVKVAGYESGYNYNSCNILSVTTNRYASDYGIYKNIAYAGDISAGLKSDGIYIATSDSGYSGKTAYVTVAYY